MNGARIVTWRRRGGKNATRFIFFLFRPFSFFSILPPSARPRFSRSSTPSPPPPPPAAPQRFPRTNIVIYVLSLRRTPVRVPVESANMCRSAAEIEKVDFGNTGGANRIRDSRRVTGTKGHSGTGNRRCPGTTVVIVGPAPAAFAVKIRQCHVTSDVWRPTTLDDTAVLRKRRCRLRNTASTLHPIVKRKRILFCENTSDRR